jgi:putative inorganic carbon (hco3(-)) transporter
LKNTVSFSGYIDKLIIIFIGISFISSQISIALSSIGVVGLIILFAVKLIIEKKFIFPEKTLLYFILVFFIWQVITSLISNDPVMALTGSLKKLSLCFVIICTVYCLKNKKDLRWLLLILFIFTAIVSVYESVRYLIDFEHQTESNLADFRLAYFGSPITLGEIKMLVLLLIVPFILSREKFILNRWVFVFLSIPILLSLYFTNSRNAMLGLFAGLVVIGIIKHRYFLTAFIASVIIFLYAAPYPITVRVDSIIQLDHPSNKARIVMWETALKMIKDKPITGFGDVDILSIYKTYKIPEFHAEGSHMHSNIFHIPVMYGITGLIIWLAMMIYIFFRQIKEYSKNKKEEFLNNILLASISCMAAFQVSGLTEWNFGDAEFAVLVWFILSFPFIAVNFSESSVK